MPSPIPPPDDGSSGTAGCSPLEGAITALALASNRLHPDDIPQVVAEHAARLGAADLTIYLSDMEQRLLVPLLAPDAEPCDRLAIDGTIAGRTYRTQQPVVVSDAAGGPGAGGGAATVWLPLLDSAERLGVISAVTAADPDTALLERLLALAGLAGEIIANKTDYGDVIARTRRTREMTLAAEMRWSMLPPLTFTGRNLTISGLVEPAYEIAGDTFDYAVNGDTAHLVIIDAVGHGLEAARIANLAVSAYRHGRRRDLPTIAIYRAMDEILAEQFGEERFATAQLASLDLVTGQLSWLNAGHPAPMLVRRGRRIDLVAAVCLPVGLAHAHADAEPRMAQTSLEPDDIVLFFTDGVSEARSATGQEFGRDRLGDLIVRALAAGQDPPETMRLLGNAILTHQLGVLQDDATLLVLAWHGAPEGRSAPGDTK